MQALSPVAAAYEPAAQNTHPVSPDDPPACPYPHGWQELWFPRSWYCPLPHATHDDSPDRAYPALQLTGHPPALSPAPTYTPLVTLLLLLQSLPAKQVAPSCRLVQASHADAPAPL